jgi:hypothetical protein
MARCFGWSDAAAEYEALYRRLIGPSVLWTKVSRTCHAVSTFIGEEEDNVRACWDLAALVSQSGQVGSAA